MSKRVVVHVGTPKTGTSQIQSLLYSNRALLARHGILYPALRHDAHFLAGLDLMGLPWGGLETEAVGAWDRLAREVRAWPGTSIISHEILATATHEQAARALASLGETEIHVVVSARDLGRQIPAEWQENVKHRATVSYADFLARIQDPERATRIGAWFWGAQELPAILERWAADVPPERVHVLTVPPAGSDPTLLPDRFLEAFFLTGVDLTPSDERANPSLGVPETALLRRINKRVNALVEPARYRPLVRELLAHQTLSQRSRSPRLALPPDLFDWVATVSATWREELEAKGYQVIGSLDELIPAPPTETYADPDAPKERSVAAAGLDAIAALITENARLLDDQQMLHEELEAVRRDLERARLRPSFRLRERIVRALNSSGVGQNLLKVYRRSRGR